MGETTLTPRSDLSMQGYLNQPKVREYLKSILKERTGQFMSNMISIWNLDMKQCEPLSLMLCGLKATALNFNLDNNLGFAYAIPYRNNQKNITEASFQIGAKGFTQLALRTGQYRKLNALAIKDGELKSWDPLTEELVLALIADPTERIKAETVGYAAYFELLNGFKKVVYWPREKVLAHAQRFSKMYDKNKKVWKGNATWESDEEAMATKTILKHILSKYGPLSSELEQAVKYDQAVITPSGEADYVDHDEAPAIEASPVGFEDDDPDLLTAKALAGQLGLNGAEILMKIGACGNDRKKLKDLIATYEAELALRKKKQPLDNAPDVGEIFK